MSDLPENLDPSLGVKEILRLVYYSVRELHQRLDRHSIRLTALETFQSKTIGAGIVLVSAATLVISLWEIMRAHR